MNIGSMARVGVSVLALAWAVVASGQREPGGPSAPAAVSRGTERAQPPIQPLADFLREIDDLHTGDRWLLMRNGANPAGPGRLIWVESPGAGAGHGMARDAHETSESAAHATCLRPVIHLGDALVVEEHTAVVDARLEAVALGSAEAGAELKARLKIGGKVVRVIAVAAGRAVLAPESEAQP